MNFAEEVEKGRTVAKTPCFNYSKRRFFNSRKKRGKSRKMQEKARLFFRLFTAISATQRGQSFSKTPIFFEGFNNLRPFLRLFRTEIFGFTGARVPSQRVNCR